MKLKHLTHSVFILMLVFAMRGGGSAPLHAYDALAIEGVGILTPITHNISNSIDPEADALPIQDSLASLDSDVELAEASPGKEDRESGVREIAEFDDREEDRLAEMVILGTNFPGRTRAEREAKAAAFQTALEGAINDGTDALMTLAGADGTTAAQVEGVLNSQLKHDLKIFFEDQFQEQFRGLRGFAARQTELTRLRGPTGMGDTSSIHPPPVRNSFVGWNKFYKDFTTSYLNTLARASSTAGIELRAALAENDWDLEVTTRISRTRHPVFRVVIRQGTGTETSTGTATGTATGTVTTTTTTTTS